MGQLSDSVTEVTASAAPRDRAVADLALTYARDIDQGGDLAKLGPALLAALEALQLSPRARKVVKVSDDKPSSNPLDDLANRRRARSAAAVDAPAS